MIDVNDCDARLPSSGEFSDLYMDELVRLSMILGRVLKTIYRYVIVIPRKFLLLFLYLPTARLAWYLPPTRCCMPFWQTSRTGKTAFRSISDSKVLIRPGMQVCSPLYRTRMAIYGCAPRTIAPALLLRVYDVLACVHANQLLVSGSS